MRNQLVRTISLTLLSTFLVTSLSSTRALADPSNSGSNQKYSHSARGGNQRVTATASKVSRNGKRSPVISKSNHGKTRHKVHKGTSESDASPHSKSSTAKRHKKSSDKAQVTTESPKYHNLANREKSSQQTKKKPSSSKKSTRAKQPRSVAQQKKAIAKIKAHNKTERERQAQDEKKVAAHCTNGATLAAIANYCHPTYKPDLRDVPEIQPPETKKPSADKQHVTSHEPKTRPQEPQTRQPSRKTPPKHKTKPKITPEQAVRKVVKASLDYHAPRVGVAPNHAGNKLTATETGTKLDSVVGYPIWFWAKGGTQQAHTVTKKLDDLKVTLAIRPTHLVVDPGNNDTVTCTGMGTVWKPERATKHPSPSPTCGYTYRKAGDYTVTMTTYWTIHYTVSDGDDTLKGTEHYHGTHTTDLAIGEYQVIVTG